MQRNKSYSNSNTLYLVATPIGNLKDMSPRALEVLSNADLIACEDTRNTSSLLLKFDIHKELVSLREHNEVSMSKQVIDLIKEGKKVCYVSDAGYPGISDPGKILVKLAREESLSVSVIPGSNALLTALVGSSLDSSHFYFHGFLNPTESKMIEELEELKTKKETLIFYESPHRIKKTLMTLYKVLGNRKISLARELTKLNEEFIEGSLEELSNIDENTLIGEMVLVVEGNNQNEEVDINKLLERSKYLLKKNISLKDVADIVSYEFNLKKNYVYDLLIKEKDNL